MDPPAGYELEAGDADVWVLRREDGSEVAHFSAFGYDPTSVEEAARED